MGRGRRIAVGVLMVGPIRAAGWFALAIVGFGASLALIDAPPAVAYQHYRFPSESPRTWVAAAILLANAVLVLTVGRSHVRAAWAWLRAAVPRGALVLVGAAVLVTSAAPSRDPVAYGVEVVFATVVQLVAVLTLVAAARSLPEGGAGLVRRVLGPSAHGPESIDRWVLGVAAFVVVGTAFLAVAVYQRHPHVPDEVVYLLHARYLAEGMLTMPLPPVPGAFNLDLMHYEATRWFSPVPPGWPFVLAVGAWFGAPWLVNPILSGVAIILAYLVLGPMYDRRTTRMAVLLLAGSPWFLFMGMNLMTHTVALVSALGAALGVARARQHGTWWPALIGGMCTGFLSLVRPLEGIAVALLVGFWSLGARGRRFRLAPSVALVVGTVVIGALAFPYNALLTGDPRAFPIMAYIDKYYVPGANAMGFGPDRGLGWSGLDPFPGHGAIDVVVNALLNTSQVSIELLGWPVGSILVIGFLLAVARRQLARADWWHLCVIAVVSGVHAFYWFSGGPDFGARYWYLIIVSTIALVARALTHTGTAANSTDSEVATRRMAVGMVLVLAALMVYVPWRSVGKYQHYRGMRPDIRALAREHDFGASLVLVRGRRFPDYASAATYNPIDLRAAAPIYAWDATLELREQVLGVYGARRVWIVDGPSITGDGFRVVAGPLTPDEVRASGIAPDVAGADAHVYDPVSSPRPGFTSEQPDEMR